jgi:hypothetical protein
MGWMPSGRSAVEAVAHAPEEGCAPALHLLAMSSSLSLDLRLDLMLLEEVHINEMRDPSHDRAAEQDEGG